MSATIDDHVSSKFGRYREAQRARGLKLLRVWVPDPHSSAFRQDVERQARLLRGAPEEADALDFIEAAMADIEPED